MTCIVGLRHAGRMYLGGDAAGSRGGYLHTLVAPKVFRRGPYLIGYTSSFRMGQLIQYGTKLPIPGDKDRRDILKYMCLTFVPWLRELFKNGGYLEKEKEAEVGGEFLVVVAGRLFSIQEDFQVSESASGFDACGCGMYIAWGALAGMERTKIRGTSRVRRALEIAERFTQGVSRPFTILSVKI